MRIDYLHYLQDLAETLSFTKSAENLYLTQSGLSRAIQQVENELGVSLFERKGNTLHLTEIGRTVVEQAKCVTDDYDALLGSVQAFRDETNPQASKPVVPIALLTTPGSFNIMQSFKQALMGAFPNTIIVEMSILDMVKRVEKQTPDELWVFFASAPEGGFLDGYLSERPNLSFEPVFEINAMAKLAKTHPLATKAALSREDLKNVSWAHINDFTTAETISLLTGAPRSERRVILQCRQHELIDNAILDHGAIGLTNDLTDTPDKDRFVVVPFEQMVTSKVGFIINRETDQSEETAALRSFIAKKLSTVRRLPYMH